MTYWWLQNVCRIPDGHLPKDIFYSELSTGSRTRCHLMLLFEDVAKRDLVAFDIDTSGWEEPAEARPAWGHENEKRRWKARNQMARKSGRKRRVTRQHFSDFRDSVMLRAFQILHRLLTNVKNIYMYNNIDMRKCIEKQLLPAMSKVSWGQIT